MCSLHLLTNCIADKLQMMPSWFIHMNLLLSSDYCIRGYFERNGRCIPRGVTQAITSRHYYLSFLLYLMYIYNEPCIGTSEPGQKYVAVRRPCRLAVSHTCKECTQDCSLTTMLIHHTVEYLETTTNEFNVYLKSQTSHVI